MTLLQIYLEILDKIPGWDRLPEDIQKFLFISFIVFDLILIEFIVEIFLERTTPGYKGQLTQLFRKRKK